MGGLSEERPVSLKSGQAMRDALVRLGYHATAIDVGRDLPEALRNAAIEVAVLALHGPLGEDGTVQGLLEVMGIPYTGSDVAASAICMDKALTKRLLREAGVATPSWQVLDVTEDAVVQRLQAAEHADWGCPFPLFVKPLRSGSSLGISRVATPDQLPRAMDAAARIASRLLLEAEVSGVEVTQAILDGQPLPLVEIQPQQKAGFFDYARKYTPGATRYPIPPERISVTEMAHCSELGVAAYRALGCRGVARVDLIVDGQGQPWVLEINTLPGMTETSLVPKAARAVGIGFEELVERILKGASLA
jgi:D-alanine-D-alanine ligase